MSASSYVHGIQTIQILNQINSRWKFSCCPVFLDFLWTAPHHYSNSVSLSFQTLSPWINICASSQYSGLNLLFFLSFLTFWALFPKPKGTIRQCSNLENHHPSATRFVTSTLCALLTSTVIILVGAWWAGERAPNCSRALCKLSWCCLQPSEPLSYLRLLADTPADTHNLSAEEMTRGSRGSHIPGSIPSLMKLQAPHTPAKHS